MPAIPAEMKTIVIIGPQYDFSDREMKMLRDFWEKQGRILLLLDPTAKTPKLLAFLNELGVKVNDDRLMAKIKTGIQEVARVRDVIGRFLPESPITKRLGGCAGAIFVGGDLLRSTLEPDRVRGGERRAAAADPGGERILGRRGLQFDDEDEASVHAGRDPDDAAATSGSRSRKAGAGTSGCRRTRRAWSW